MNERSPSSINPGNCGTHESLSLCSRCHQAWFCSVKCQKARNVYVISVLPRGRCTSAENPASHVSRIIFPLQAYWPFHRSDCRSNDFADAIEHDEPKFARWMRKHGKLAMLKDDEIDRLDRKARWLTLYPSPPGECFPRSLSRSRGVVISPPRASSLLLRLCARTA